jgi:hypothetical protein
MKRLLDERLRIMDSTCPSPAARRAVQKQQREQHRDQAAFQQEIEKKHLDD